MSEYKDMFIPLNFWKEKIRIKIRIIKKKYYKYIYIVFT